MQAPLLYGEAPLTVPFRRSRNITPSGPNPSRRPRWHRKLPAALLCAALSLVGARAHADAQENAARLFEQGRSELQSGHSELGCTHILESYRLSPAVGAQLNVAYCEELRGKRARALRLYRNARGQIAPGDARLVKVNQRIHSLESMLPTVIVRVAAQAPVDTQVLIDDEALSLAELGKPYELDPGVKHAIVARAGNGFTATETVSVMGGEKREVTLTPVAPPPPEPPPPPPAQPPPVTTADTAPPPPAVPVYHSVGVLILGAVAVAAVAPAIIFSVDAGNKNSDISAAPRGVCAVLTSPACQAVQGNIDARGRDRTIAWVSLGVSGAALATAGVLWIVFPSSSSATTSSRTSGAHSFFVPAVEPRAASLLMVGTF